jgi:hypothetical protein
MAKYFKSSRFYLFISIVVCLAIACNNKTDEKATEKKDTTSETTRTSQTTQPKAAFTGGVTLDVLYTDAASFQSIHQGDKLFFVLTYIDPDIVTLHGWATPNGNFSNPPDIRLEKGTPSINLGLNPAYVGNVKLDWPEIKRIQDSITSTSAKYVVFVPTPSITYRNHVEYSVSVSQDPPTLDKTIQTTSTGVTANPSPPKAL